MIKCSAMLSPKSYRTVANQYVIRTDNSIIFQSYASTIAVFDKVAGRLTLGVDFDYSRTTAKYLHQFINRYCPGSLVNKINAAPGNCFTARLRWCINHGVIAYDGGLI